MNYKLYRKLAKSTDMKLIGSLSLSSNTIDIRTDNNLLRKMFRAGLLKKDDKCIFKSIQEIKNTIYDIVDRPFYIIPNNSTEQFELDGIPLSFKFELV